MATSTASLRKHGTFIYEVPATIAHYGTSKLAIEAMQRAEMTHAWVRIHSKTAYSTNGKKAIAGFIKDLKTAGINVAGW
jgi:hypothetical protein